MIDIDEWQTSLEFFSFMNQLWGPYTVDRFANFYNAKLVRFNSKFWNPGSEAVDAFSQDWKNENNWIVPPINQVAKSIKHLVFCKASGTLIVPKWDSASFWTMIFKGPTEKQPYVLEILEFSPGQNVLIQGRNKNSVFGSSSFNSEILAVRLKMF